MLPCSPTAPKRWVNRHYSELCDYNSHGVIVTPTEAEAWFRDPQAARGPRHWRGSAVKSVPQPGNGGGGGGAGAFTTGDGVAVG